MALDIPFVASLPVVVTGGTVIGMAMWDPNPQLDVKTLIEVALFVSGIFGTAAVMRKDVSTLNKWKESQGSRWEEHSGEHSKLDAILAKLTQISEDNSNRIARLERQDDAERFKDRGHRG